MALWPQVQAILSKEITLEMRNRYAINGILLYVVSTVFVCYLSFQKVLTVPVWNALFWVIMLFASVNAVSKSFLTEHRERMLYYHALFSPQAFVLAKLMYNMALMMVISILCSLAYMMFVGNLVQDHLMFFVALLLGSSGFASIFTLMSAIAAKTDNNLGLTAILGFPLQVPFLIVLIKFSKNAVDGLDRSVSTDLGLILLAINVLVITLSYLLFPYLWRD
jgi:heme exporter protein B